LNGKNDRKNKIAKNILIRYCIFALRN